MRFVIYFLSKKKSFKYLCIFLLQSTIGIAQQRAYNLVYSGDIKGGTAMFGNTLLHIVDNGSVNFIKMNDNSANGNSIYGNDNENMQYIDIDGTEGNGSVTRNSSSADLILPTGNNTIKLARIYWGGRLKDSDFDLTADSNKIIKIRKGTAAAYTNVAASGIDKIVLSTGFSQYQAYADITPLIKDNGAGTYEVGNVPLTTGHRTTGGNNGGWCIVVVYENNTSSYNSVRLYDGFQNVYNGGDSLANIVTLTGLNVPSGNLAASDAQMGVLAWEGDANLAKDYLKINSNLFSNATNPADNPWNGTITNNGVHVTTKNPDYTNQMGIDIDQFDVGTGYAILPNATSVTLEFGTEADQYFPGLFTFTIKVKEPVVTIDNTVSDENNNHLAEANEVLTYTLKGINKGNGNANEINVIDTLPSTVTYVPNSLNIISCPGINSGIQTDTKRDDAAEYINDGDIKTIQFRLGAGATSTKGGTLEPSENYEVQFKVMVNDPGIGNPVPSILNIARITAQSDANAGFVDDGTSIINADFGPLPVTMVSFTANLVAKNAVKLNWSTSMEINCSKYIIERSDNGKSFSEIASVAGSGTTSLLHSYSYTDNLFSTSPVIYYRIKQSDVDGKGIYTKIISVKLKNYENQVSISPNPFTSYLNITIEWLQTEMIHTKIIDAKGKTIFSKNIQMDKGFNYISLNELASLPAGAYFIEFISGPDVFTRKVIKQ